MKFPRVCPICLAPADSEVIENTDKRQTANYLVARRLEWWRTAVPHCRECAARLQRNNVIGLFLGTVCALVVFVLLPPEHSSVATIGYLLFGYPAWALMATMSKGIILNHGSNGMILAQVRRSEYFRALTSLNGVSVFGPAPH